MHYKGVSIECEILQRVLTGWEIPARRKEEGGLRDGGTKGGDDEGCVGTHPLSHESTRQSW